MAPSILKPKLVDCDLLPFARCNRDFNNGYLSPHVHFPPTPVLTSSENTHSSTSYDRAPIEVSPNICALPERGGRVYHDSRPQTPKRSYFHPRAFEAFEPEPLTSPPASEDCPVLIKDLGSSGESDDSALGSPAQFPVEYSPIPFRRASSQKEFDLALQFLPHAPEANKGCLKSRKSRKTGAPAANRYEAPQFECLDGF